MKYKVGDRVRIVSEVPEWAERSSVWQEWAGKVVTIKGILEYGGIYLMSEAGGWWFDTDIAGLADEDGSNRREVLETAKEKVCHERKDQYGGLEDNFAMIAKNWTDYLSARRNPAARFELEPHDVAVMMMYLKMARIATGEPKADNWIDIAGYAACGGELQCRGDGNAET